MTTTSGAKKPMTSNDPKMQEALERISTAVAAMHGSEEWLRWMRFGSMMHTYSFNNLLLIMVQRPDATQVMALSKWNKIGRRVIAGEHGIVILAPTIKTIMVADETGREVPRRALIGYHAARTFDIAQTHGAPVPEHPKVILPEGAAPANGIRRLLQRIKDDEWTVVIGQVPLEGAKGLTDFNTKTITIQHDMSDAAKFKTLVHEEAHRTLHGPTVEREARLCREDAEVEAESVAFMVCDHLGLATGDYSFGYVAGWAAKDPNAVKRSGETIMKTARALINVCEGVEE